MTNPFRSGGALIGRFYLRYLSLCITRSGKRWTSLLAVLIIVIIYYYFATDFFFWRRNEWVLCPNGWLGNNVKMDIHSVEHVMSNTT